MVHSRELESTQLIGHLFKKKNVAQVISHMTQLLYLCDGSCLIVAH